MFHLSVYVMLKFNGHIFSVPSFLLSFLIIVLCSTFQDGFELPSRLSISAADCILSISEALTKKNKVLSKNRKLLNSNASDPPISPVPAVTGEKSAKTSSEFSDSNFDMAYLLWERIQELTTLMQRLLAVCSIPSAELLLSVVFLYDCSLLSWLLLCNYLMQRFSGLLG